MPIPSVEELTLFHHLHSENLRLNQAQRDMTQSIEDMVAQSAQRFADVQFTVRELEKENQKLRQQVDSFTRTFSNTTPQLQSLMTGLNALTLQYQTETTMLKNENAQLKRELAQRDQRTPWPASSGQWRGIQPSQDIDVAALLSSLGFLPAGVIGDQQQETALSPNLNPR
ncbi:MAG: hypothetical protein NTW08_04445 [Gammaproteobacteria bacterium]|nr:hypothetical protein [Gammaproteobacteria bacterium]